ncbi:MAG: carbon storage regulator [Polyangiaceae bacterium]
MLIITRRRGQRIVLGHDIEIVITDISRSGVKIGIVAPATTTILRGEVRDAVEQANRQALESFADPEAAPAGTSGGAVASGDASPATVVTQSASSAR